MQAYACCQGHEPLCFGPVITRRHYCQDEPASSEADLLDQNRVPGIRQHDHDAAVIDKAKGKPHVAKRMDRPYIHSITDVVRRRDPAAQKVA